ncbi:glycosyl hydrolase family 28-related protein [Algoriphagus chordae]|uniref:Parallel beta helix pectate lyase-like protein n=1 Tax=Algoriphagus chordae TaxID=237019 RepID=A0A2W7QIH1_9BACT|nr:right-handed parallel beta-helix repeat-containing protein [Algoriphagus chordae]PZX48294.1 parallel beta helix pectate lyase-like protein [Algoriphagus chordae]
MLRGKIRNTSIALLLTPLLAAIPFYGFCLQMGQQEEVINVRDFGAIPNDGKDDTAFLRKAAEKARTTPNATLYFPAGEYQLRDQKAVDIQEAAFAGELGANPQEVLYVPNQEYVIGLDFEGADGLTIDANDVKIIFDGWMEPVSFRNTQNVTLNGLTIDYKKRPNSYGEIIKLGEDYVDVEFPEEEEMTDEMLILRVMLYNKEKKSLVGTAVYFDSKKGIAPNVLRFYGAGIRNQAELGRVLITFSGFHYRPAILIYKTKDITLNDVTINAQAGMGIVGHLSKNITMNRLKVVPPAGRYVSSNTDATHFATNRGFIRFDDCEFEGQGDDATNVHNYYAHIVSRPAENVCETFLGEKNFTHSTYQDEPQNGDVLAVIEKSTLKEVGYIRVSDFETNPEERLVKITFDGDLPEDIENYYLANMSATPSLEFANSQVRSHRARSVLVKTRKVLIENSSFENTTGTAIHIGAEGNWLEGVASEDVIIRNNTFTNCGLGGNNDGTIDGASAIAIHVNAPDRTIPGLHKRILIENNKVIGGEHAFTVKGAENVTIRNNEFLEIVKEPIVVGASRKVSAYENKGAADIASKISPVIPIWW